MNVTSRCQTCGEPAVRSYANLLLCEKCAARHEEYDQHWVEYQKGLIQWNTSRHDPFWRGWLTSRELFATIHDTVPRIGKRIYRLAGGDIFESDGGFCGPMLHVWLTATEVVVAYTTFAESHQCLTVEEGLKQFEDWVSHLRYSPPLELGFVRGGSSYGATILERSGEQRPVVKWCQAGDWAAMARNWFVGDDREFAPWP